jgi:hypothetical protein
MGVKLGRLLKLYPTNFNRGQKLFQATIYKKHKQKPILTETKIRKWKWIGHMLTKPLNNITKTAAE